MRSLTQLSLTVPFVFVGSLYLTAPDAAAQCALAKITEAVSNDVDEFGDRIALDGDLLAVTERGVDQRGAVHLFDVSEVGTLGKWTPIGEVQPADSVAGQLFGESIDVSGRTLVAGAADDDELGPNAGAAYVFERNDNGTPTVPGDDFWVEIAELHPSGASLPTRFGETVALEGDTLVVAAPGTGSLAALFVFHRDHLGTPDPFDDLWVQVARIDPDGLSTFSSLGQGLDLSRDEGLILAGDTRDTTGSGTGGAGLLFARQDTGAPGDPRDDTWVPAGKLVRGPASSPYDSMGSSVVLGDDVAFISAPFGGFDYGGRVIVFDRDGQGTADPLDDVWTEGQELNGQGSIYANFGDWMAVDGERFAASQTLWQFPPSWGTNVLVFERTAGTWSEVERLEAPDRQVADGVGSGVALDGSLLFTGANGAFYIDDHAPADGAVYAWDLDRPQTWDPDPWFLGDFQQPILSGWGNLEPRSRFGLRSYDLFDNAPTWFFLGFSRIDQPFSGGVLIPSPDVIIGPVPTDSFGSVTLEGFWPDGVPPGTTFWLQSWAMDPGFAPFGLGDSPGIEVVTP